MREDWVETKLGEIWFTTSGGTPSRQNVDFYNGDICWVKSGELDQGIIVNTEEKITEEAINKSSAKIFPKGTLLIALYGATIGKLAFLGVEAATNQAICGIFKNERVESKFLYYYLFHKKQKLIGKGTGGAQPNISQTILKKLIVPLAPLPEQRAIVKKIEQLFTNLDKGIESLKTAQEQLKVYRQAVLKKAFEGELTKEWRTLRLRSGAALPTADELLKQIKEEREKHYKKQLDEWKLAVKDWEKNGKVGKKPSKPKKLTIPEEPNKEHYNRIWELPNHWTWSQIGQVCFVTKLAGFEYTKYVNYDESGDFAVIKAENAGTNGFKRTKFSMISSKSVSMLTRSFLHGGELLVVFVGAGTGSVATVPFDRNYFLGPNIGMARPYFEINTKYLEYYLQSPMGKHVMMATVKAVAQPSLSMGTIRQTPVALPFIEEQHQIVQEIESRLSVTDKVEESIKESLLKAEALRQSILKKAFEGALLTDTELADCRLEADWEPAEVLLKRIKDENRNTTKRKK